LGNYIEIYCSIMSKFLVNVNKPDWSLVDYEKFLVEPVVAYLTPEAAGYSLDHAILKKYANAFYRDLRASLGKDYKVVDGPGPGVLRVRAAITEIELNKDGILQKGAVEIDFRDSVTNQRVLAIVDSRKVESFSWWANTLASRLNDLNKETILITSDTK